MDRARESIVTARESQNEDPTDLEWPGIEEGSIDWLRSLMEVARAGGLDVSAYEAAITGTPEDSGDDESDDAEADADPADVDVAALAHPGESLIAAGTRFYVFENPMCGFRIVRLADGAEATFHGDDSCERFRDHFYGDEDTDHPADNADAADDVGDWAENEFTTAAEREAIEARLTEKYPALVL